MTGPKSTSKGRAVQPPELGPVRNPMMMPFNCSHRNKNVSKHRVRLISLVPFVWESNPKLQGGWRKTEPPDHRGSAAHPGGAGTREEPGTLTGCACSPWFVSFGLFGLCTRVFPGYLGIRKAKDNAASWMREVQVEISYKFHKTILNTRGYRSIRDHLSNLLLQL